MMELTEEYMAYLRANISLCNPLVQSLVARLDRVEKEAQAEVATLEGMVKKALADFQHEHHQPHGEDRIRRTEGGGVMSDITEARQYLTTVMESEFKDKTFRPYINGTLAGDFAAEMADVVRSLRTRAEAAERERDEAYAAGQRDFQERVAKRLDDLAMEQKSWHNHCAASVIRMEANAVRSLPIKDSP